MKRKHRPGPIATEGMNASQMGRLKMLSCVGEPLFYADWERAVFIHYEVDAEALQRWVPYSLDLHEGRAFVSLVAFTMRGMRLRVAGSIGATMFAPIASHDFLNVRTYVKHGQEVGIFFIREWLPNRLAICLGPAVFGLPYRYGRLKYEHRHEQGCLKGSVSEGEGDLIYQIELNNQNYRPAVEKMSAFLLERYTAYTHACGMRRLFRVWHEPWQQVEVEVQIDENTLLARAPGGNEWAREARLVGANYTPGANKVWMGRPRFVGSN